MTASTLACIAAGLENELDVDRTDDRPHASLLVLPILGFASRDVAPLVSPSGGEHRHLAHALES